MTAAPPAVAATMAGTLNWTVITDSHGVPLGAYYLSTVGTSEAITEAGPGVGAEPLLVNGGEVALRDAEASLAAGRPLIVLAGSGRSADDIARARADEPASKEVAAVAASSLTSVVDGRDPQAILGATAEVLAPH